MPPRKALEGRNGEIYRRSVIYGWTYERIAEEYGISIERVGQIVREAHVDMPSTDRAQLLAESIDRMRELQEQAMELVLKEGAPVTAGKDGDVVRDPDTDEVVRDYGARLAALNLMAKLDEQWARRFGLNAPEKMETTSTVKYVIEGVDTDNLT